MNNLPFFFANTEAFCFLCPVFEECILIPSFVDQLKASCWHFKLLLVSCPLSSAEGLYNGKYIVRGAASGASEEP